VPSTCAHRRHLYAGSVYEPDTTRQILRLFAVRVLFALKTVSRILRFNRPRRLPTSTRASRGPWLARRLCCPSRSSLTMTSSEPLDLQRSDLRFSRNRRPRSRPRAAIQRVPNLLRKTVRPCRLPYPGGFVSAYGCCFLTNSGLRRRVSGSASAMCIFEAAEFA